MKRILWTLILCASCLLSNAQQNVYKMPVGDNTAIKGQTFCYMLPTTGFQVTLSVTKVREIKGYYADHAESLLGLNNVIQENRTYYKVNEVAVKPVQMPDTTQAYLVQLSKAQAKAGFLEKMISCKRQHPASSNAMQWYTTASTPIPDFFKNYAELSYSEQEDSYLETKIIDGVVTQVPANKTKKVSKTSIQKAQEAADAISKSRKDQYSLVAGEQETPYSEEALSRMLQNLKQWEENYLSLFTGLTLEDEITYTFYVIPDQSLSCPLFAFDPATGVSFDNLTGNNVYRLVLGPKANFEPIANEVGSIQANSKNNGYRIRSTIPIQVMMTFQGKRIHDFGFFDMSQYGPIQILPAHFDNFDIHKYGFIF